MTVTGKKRIFAQIRTEYGLPVSTLRSGRFTNFFRSGQISTLFNMRAWARFHGYPASRYGQGSVYASDT